MNIVCAHVLGRTGRPITTLSLFMKRPVKSNTRAQCIMYVDNKYTVRHHSISRLDG
jgi:hypothetical protein